MVVDQQFAAMQAGAAALATSPFLASGNLAAFHRQAQAVVHDYPDGTAITLADATGQQLANTFFPLGTPLPNHVVWDRMQRVFDTGKPVIVNLYKGTLTGRFVVGIAVPVISDGRVKYVLAMTVPANHFDALLSQQSVPPDWITAIEDGNRVLVSRNQLPEKYVGLIATPDIVKRTSAAYDGAVETINRENIPILAVFSRSTTTDWSVIIAIPKAVMLAGLRPWLWWTVGGGLLILIIGIALALCLARRIAASIHALIAPALALGSGQPVSVKPLDLAETNEVGQSLVKASQLLQQRTAERNQAEQRSAYLASFPELNANPILEIDLRGKITYANPAARKSFPGIEEIGTGHPILNRWSEVTAAIGAEARQHVLKREVEADGSVFQQTIHYIPNLGLVRVYFADITERKQAEEQLQKLNRTLIALSNSNQALMHATDELTFLQQVCRIIVEDCGHAMVWIGYAENDEDKTVRPVAHAGFEEGYLETLRLTWADSERGRGPTGTAIRTGHPSTSRNMLTDPTFLPWRADAIKRGYASSLVVPLKEGDKVFGAITIYSREPDTFAEGEVSLLMELAGDLAYGINTLRTRAAQAKAEEALRENEQQFRELAEGIPQLAWTAYPDGGIYWYNQRWYQYTGTTPRQMEGWGWQSVHDPKELPKVVERWKISIATGEPFDMVFPLLGADGVFRPFLTRVMPLRDAQGRVVRWFGTNTDISEQRRIEEALRQSEERYRSLFENMSEGFAHCKMLFDDRGRPVDFIYLNVNRAFGMLTGLENVVGKRVTEVIPGIKESDPELLEAYGRVALTGQPERFEVKVKSLDMWFSISVYGPAREHFVAVFDVITERKRAEEALRQNEERWATTLRSIGDAVISTCARGKVIFMNEVAQTLTGWPLVDAQGKDLETVFNIVNEVTRVRSESPVSRVIHQGQTVGLANHTALISRDGTEYPIEDSAAPIRNKDGEITGIVLVFHDVVEKRKAEKAVQNSERLATTGRLAATLAHEIHNPLDTVGNLLYLMNQAPDPEASRQYVELASQEVARVTQMTRHMLAFQRESNKPVPVNVAEILDSVVVLFERKIQSAGIQVEKHVHFEREFLGLPGEMRQVFANLFGNAVEAVGKNGKIRLSAYASQNWRTGEFGLRVVVADNGPGIPKNIRGKIFEPFFTTKGEAGTGLGLWITSGIVNNSGGTLRLRSVTRDGRTGTCFSVFLPIK